MTDLEKTAERLDAIAAELTKALGHCRTAADHFRNKEVPRGCAHILALQGHIFQYETILREIAVVHSTKASVPPDMA